MTPEERMLWNHLRQNRCAGFHFRRQQVISGFIAVYCDAARLAVELDGAFHEPAYDAERDDALARAGLVVLRIENPELRQESGSDIGANRGKSARTNTRLDLTPSPFP